jgi:hypothetical protein
LKPGHEQALSVKHSEVKEIFQLRQGHISKPGREGTLFPVEIEAVLVITAGHEGDADAAGEISFFVHAGRTADHPGMRQGELPDKRKADRSENAGHGL